ncbi:MAG: hypothetical protein RJB59_144, partial [Actinomycetota bacterium]
TLTIPLKYYNYRKNGVSGAVLWDPVLATELFSRIKNDEALLDKIKADPSTSPTVIDKFKTGSAADNPCKG